MMPSANKEPPELVAKVGASQAQGIAFGTNLYQDKEVKAKLFSSGGSHMTTV